MKRKITRTLSVLLALLLLLTALPTSAGLFTASAEEETYAVGDLIEYGSYPQTRVKDTDLLTALNTQTRNWTSYGYYVGRDDYGTMTQSDYMKYADVTYDGNRYRAVRFTEFRVPYTTMSHQMHRLDVNQEGIYQAEYGYTTNTVYWFLYEPIRWRILDPASKLVMCETVLDAQPYSNLLYCVDKDGDGSIGFDEYFNNAAGTNYANDYATSSIRAWLNGSFYRTAFNTAEQNNIVALARENKAFENSRYDSAKTTDKVTLLSITEAQNTAYGFTPMEEESELRIARASHYAKAQGLLVDRGSWGKPGVVFHWLLRTPSFDSNFICCGHLEGGFRTERYTNCTAYGVRPVLNLQSFDTTKPTGVIDATNNVASNQTVTLTLSDNEGVAGYYWGTSSSLGAYTAAADTTITQTVSSEGTYYLSVKDSSGNVSETVSVTFYKTTFDADGGTVSPTSVLTKSGNSFRLPAAARPKHRLIRWATTSGGATGYSGESSYTPSASRTLYAVWESSAAAFSWGEDNWSYNNSAYDGSFSSGTYRSQINSTYSEALKNNLTNSEYQYIFGSWSTNIYGISTYNNGWLDDAWGGSCYGMSSLTLLAKEGLFPYAQYKTGATTLYELSRPTADSSISSLVTYYQMLQIKNVIQQQFRTVPGKTHETNIKSILDLLDASNTVLVCFKKDGWGGHAVLAYGYAYDTYTWNGVEYQGCIKICDPNSSSAYNDRYNIYFNTQTYSWTIPAYSAITSANGAKFMYMGASIDDINKGGYLTGSTITPTIPFVGRINTAAISDTASITKVKELDGVYVPIETAPGEIVEEYSYILKDADAGTPGYNLYDAEAAYLVSQSEPGELTASMEYEYCTLTAGSAAGTSVLFDPAGYVQVKGEAADYTLSMVFDDDHPTGWFAVRVSGSGAKEASLTKTENGYIFHADKLENVVILVNNREEKAAAGFSTEYDSVLIVETDENTIGVMADADGDGTYETALTIETIALYILGDVDGDRKITASDARLVLRRAVDLEKYAEGSAEFLACDADKDGNVTAEDARMVLRAAVGLENPENW